MGTELTIPERAELQRLEAVVEKGLSTFVDVGNALGEICNKRLYRAEAPDFETYCRKRWQIEKGHAYRLIEAASVVKEVAGPASPMGDKLAPSSQTDGGKDATQINAPTSERQARELAKAPAGKRKEAWQQAVTSAPKGKDGKPKVTAAHVRRVVRQADAPKPDPEPKPSKPAVPCDARGTAFPRDSIREAFDTATPELNRLATAVSAIKRDLKKLANTPAGAFLDEQEVDERCDNLRQLVTFAKPYAVCAFCGGEGCRACHDQGWLPEKHFNQIVPEEMRA